MYLSAQNKNGRFFNVPRDYENWHGYEQMYEWDKRAARAADAFRLVVRKVNSLPNGAAKKAFEARIGQKSNPNSPASLYEWIWHHAAQPNMHVWGDPTSQDRVELLEGVTAAIKKDMKSQGLGDMAWTKVNPWVWVVTGGLGVVGLGYMLFVRKGR